ncbi:DUF1572 family protein [Sphingobacterium pedocola]|uniref:DUF1572 domain-containing protein n=1 Tax=Sphingobacterium pedocola TaxID=2082722 RepID=A0ABR9T7E8_9SPHI|nr:DUF1572 family protein [Sphingobacterium pedocola]MBE8721250.1 hypothetical protein [Sphingobacterium pedocola]
METSYINSVIKQFRYYKILAEKAMEQLDDESLFWQYNGESNSIAIIVNHISGNMQSRFTDFLTSDGEKAWRNRDAEFEHTFHDRSSLIAHWEKGWECLINVLSSLRKADLESIVYIRNDGHTVMEALNRQLAHYPYHIGQIVYVAKMVKNEKWKTLSIARNSSAQYNERKFEQDKERRHFTDDL